MKRQRNSLNQATFMMSPALHRSSRAGQYNFHLSKCMASTQCASKEGSNQEQSVFTAYATFRFRMVSMIWRPTQAQAASGGISMETVLVRTERRSKRGSNQDCPGSIPGRAGTAQKIQGRRRFLGDLFDQSPTCEQPEHRVLSVQEFHTGESSSDRAIFR